MTTCEHVTTSGDPRKSGHRCTRTAKWMVTYRIFTGKAFTKPKCTQHAKATERVEASHPL